MERADNEDFFEIVETEGFEEFAAYATRSYEEATGVGEGHGRCVDVKGI